MFSLTTDNGSILSQQRYLPFGEIRTDTGSITQTDFGYTGQRTETAGLGLMDYHARDYDPVIGKFIQPDTIIPNLASPQSLNRYAYVLNQPVNLNDPTGRDPWWDDDNFGYADKHPIMSVPLVYIVAGIKVQTQYQTQDHKVRGTDPYASLGDAMVSDKQMNTAYGNRIPDSTTGETRGYGLGMPGKDQLRSGVAFEAMGKEIQLVMEHCTKCSVTDLFIGASQAQNGPGFDQKNMQTLSAPQNRVQPGFMIDWPGWFGAKPFDPRFVFGARHQLNLFADNVEALKKKGWYVPAVDWNAIKNLK